MLKTNFLINVLKFFILLISFSLSAADITVPVGGNIQDAIDDVNESGGGIVTLAAGTFTVTSSLKIKSNVTLQGSGIYASTIATTQNIKIIEQSGYGLNNITIRNLTLKGTNKVDGGGMDIISYGTEHDTILISNVRCYNTGWGVHIKGARNVLIENCDFSENGAIGKEGYAHNLYLRRVYGAVVKNSSLNNSITGNGINISYSEDVEIRDSEMIGNFFRGVRAAVSRGYLVHDCIITDNIEIGIFANSETNGFTTTDVDIQNNCVSGSKDGIRIISGATGIVMNNNSYGNDDDYDITGSVSDINNISDASVTCDGSVQPQVCDSHDAFSTIQAEDFCDEEGVQINTNNPNVGYIQNGDWIMFSDVDFGSGADTIEVSVSSGSSGGTIEIRQGSTSGILLGTVEVVNTGSWTTWETVSSNISSVTGEQDIYFVFTGGNDYLLDVDSFTFLEGTNTTVNTCNSPLSDITPPSNITSGINYSYYEGSWNALPNFSSLTPVSNGLSSSIDLNNAVSADNFGLNFEGYIDIPSDDNYTFYTTSDDGSALWIDGVKVVDNDGLHGAKEESGTICLDAGYHQIEVQFFEKTGGNVLSVAYEAPSISKTTSLDLYGISVSTACSIPWNDSDFTVSNSTINYTSEAIDISCASGVRVSMDIEGIGSMEDADYLNIYYKIDGGSQQVISENVNAFSEKTVSFSGISGNTIEIIINGATSVASETYYVSNILVESDTNNGNTDCAGIVGGSASLDACGICSGGTTGVSATSQKTWYADADGDGAGDPDTAVEQCDQPNGYVSVAGDNCPNDANKNEPGDCGCGIEEGTCSDSDCNNTTAFTEAECYDTMDGVVVESSNGDGENLGYLDDGDWARYNDINVSGMNTFNAQLSTQNSGRSIEIRLDSENGTLVGTLSVPNTGAWHDYVTASTSISSVSGTHDIFLVFKGGSFNIGSFGFSEEEIVEPTDCSSFYGGLSIAQRNPGCSNNDGQITLGFANSSAQTQIQISLDGGNSYPVTVNDNSGSYTFTGLSVEEFEVAVKYTDGTCEFNVGTVNLVPDCGDIDLNPGGVSWHDSYEANGFCWCSTNFDHDLDDKEVTINGTRFNVVDICDELEDHPLFRNRNSGDAIYNDVQCGNGPLNDSSDEPICPGRVDNGADDCLVTGVRWDMEWLAGRSRFGGSSSKDIFGTNGVDYKVSPNPVLREAEITIASDSNVVKVQLYDMNGKLINDTLLDGNKMLVNPGAPGLYILHILFEDRSIELFKLIVH